MTNNKCKIHWTTLLCAIYLVSLIVVYEHLMYDYLQANTHDSQTVQQHQDWFKNFKF